MVDVERHVDGTHVDYLDGDGDQEEAEGETAERLQTRVRQNRVHDT